MLKQNKPVIFSDEATFGPWHRYSIVKAWVDKDNPFPYYRNTHFASNVTMFGAISNVFSEPVFYTAKTTNIENW